MDNATNAQNLTTNVDNPFEAGINKNQIEKLLLTLETKMMASTESLIIQRVEEA